MSRLIIRKEENNPAELNLHETLFGNSNGYIGVRGTLEEGVPDAYPTMRGMYLNGVYEIIPMKQAESLCNLIEKKQTMLNVCDTQTIRLSVCGEPFSLQSGTLLSNERVLDMERGVTERHVTWRSPGGREVRIRTRRMASFERPELFTMEYEVEALNFEGELSIESSHNPDVRNFSDPNDPRLAAESPVYLKVKKLAWEKSVSISLSETKESGITVAAAVSHIPYVQGESSVEFLEGEGSNAYCVKATVSKGKTLRLLKYAAFSDSIRQKDPEEHAVSVLEEAKSAELTDLYEEQRAYLSDFWKSADMEIEGDEELSEAAAFNMYQLLQAAPQDEYCSIAAKGLSGEGYEGHYFWDTEMYVVPFFLLTDPSLAKTVLSYRYKTLDKARENAALLGHKKGALYPWRTITGEECSGYFPSGTAAYHINGAISYAVIQYYLTTGDKDFMEEKGLEILLETARLWLDTGNYDRAGRFVINEVTGPDEYTCMTDNNFYTNCTAKYDLKWAAKLAAEWKEDAPVKDLLARLSVTEEELLQMKRAAEKMYLPYDEEYGINPQDDSFLQKPVWDIKGTPKNEFPLLLHYHPLHLYRYQVCKQADTVLAHFLFPEESDRETMEKSFRYYEKITTHDSSLSTCVFSMQASRLGFPKEALDYFGDSAKLDLLNTHNNTKDGVHTANMGGCYMAIVNGFAGLRITEEGVALDPILPEGWKGYGFSFRYHDSLMSLKVTEGGAYLTLLSGEEQTIRCKGTTYRIDSKSTQIS